MTYMWRQTTVNVWTAAEHTDTEMFNVEYLLSRPSDFTAQTNLSYVAHHNCPFLLNSQSQGRNYSPFYLFIQKDSLSLEFENNMNGTWKMFDVHVCVHVLTHTLIYNYRINVTSSFFLFLTEHYTSFWHSREMRNITTIYLWRISCLVYFTMVIHW